MPGFLSSIFGSKPSVPTLPSLNLPAEQQKALAANIAAIPGAEEIAGKVDLFNQQQIDQMLENVIPNYKAITGNIGQNIEALTAGQIPTDVSQEVQRSDAARAIGGGFAGSEAQRNLTARDLGLTSLDLTSRGLASAESWMRTAASIYEPGMFNVASMFISPAQQAQFDVSEREAQFQRQWMQSQINAMPDPTVRGLYDTTMTIIGEALSAYGGGAGYSSSNVAGGKGSSTDFSGGRYTNFFGGGGNTGGGYTDFFGGGGGVAGGGSFGGTEGDFGGGFGGGFGGFV